MRAIRCNEWKPFRELEVVDIPSPVLGAGQVRIGVHYAGVSFATALVTRGQYQPNPPPPFTPGTRAPGGAQGVAPGGDRAGVGGLATSTILVGLLIKKSIVINLFYIQA